MAGNRKEVKGRKKKVFQAINEKVSDMLSIYFGNSNQYYIKNPAILTTGIKRNFVIYMLCRIMDIKFEMIILNGSHSTN